MNKKYITIEVEANSEEEQVEITEYLWTQLRTLRDSDQLLPRFLVIKTGTTISVVLRNEEKR